MKKFILAAASVALAAMCAVTVSGCVNVNGLDGKDGADANIYDIYNAVNEERKKSGLEELTFLDFAAQYLSYSGEQIENSSDMQAVINRSLLSSVSIIVPTSGSSAIAGSGFIVEVDKEAGNMYVMTNYHVVYNSGSFVSKIWLYPYAMDANYNDRASRIEQTEIVSASLTYDLALLKVENSTMVKNGDFRAVEFSQSENFYVGEPVFAIGNSDGDGMAATKGIISKECEEIALDVDDDGRAEMSTYRVIRTDATVNGGNSGGALFDSNGKVVGVINSKVTTDGVENTAFALSSSYVRRIYKLMRDGVFEAGYSGIYAAQFPAEFDYTTSSRFDSATNRTEITDKMVIREDNGGFKNGDVLKRMIIKNGNTVVEDKPLTRYYNIEDILLSYRSGYTAECVVERNEGEEVTVGFTPDIELLD